MKLGSANRNLVVMINEHFLKQTDIRRYNMAISRGQLVKELEPGLNALFGSGI